MVSAADPPASGRLPEIGVAPSKNTTVPAAEVGVTFAAKVSEAPTTDGLVPDASVIAVVEFAFGLLTVCDKAEDVDPLKVASPLYCAVMECVPDDNADVVKLAAPPSSATSPEIALLPSKNTTVPLAELGITLAEKVSKSPTRDGLVPAVNAKPTVVLGLLTVCTRAALTEDVSRLSPVYLAVMECGPRPKSAVLKDTEPLLSAITLEIGMPPSRNWTEP
jgi:hypothetical protein